MLKTLHAYRFRTLRPDSPTSLERRAFVEKPVEDILRDTRERNIALQVWVVVGRNFIEKMSGRIRWNQKYQEQKDHRLLLEILSKAGVSFVDFAEDLQLHNPKEICSFGEHLDEHINEKGNAIVAKVGSEKLRMLLRKDCSKKF